jgi:uncharacterized protein YdhG (YjbR/CyaY superfamily)
MFKPTTAKTPEEYITMIDEPRREEITKLHEFIKKTVPHLKPHILAGMIGYGTFHYKSKSGREGDWSSVALASQKNYISVYICASDGKQYVAEKNKDKFPKASVGKSCIRFKKLEDIDLNALKKVILEGVTTGLPQM